MKDLKKITWKVESQITGYEVDSRRVLPGFVFFSLKGQRDGHDFLQQAAAQGAIFAVVEEGYRGPSFHLELIRVKNTQLTLQKLAQDSLLETHQKIVAITGSLGKTTTKEFTYTLLKKAFKTYKSPRNFNSQIGLPLAVLNRDKDAEVLILEMAMSDQGQIRRLVEIAPPDIALITNVEMVHIDSFKDLEGIARAKAEVFAKMQTKIKLIPKTLLSYPFLRKDMVTFSISENDADFVLEKGFYLKHQEEISKKFSLPFHQEMFVQDFLYAAVIAKCLGLSLDEIIERVPFLQTVEKRFEKKQIQGTTFINDAYNSSPLSCRLALQEIPTPQGKGRKIAVLGPIAELGKFFEEEHYKLGKIAASHVDILFCYHENSKAILRGFLEKNQNAEIFFDKETLARKLRKMMQKDDVFLIKASNLYQLDGIFSFFL